MAKQSKTAFWTLTSYRGTSNSFETTIYTFENNCGETQVFSHIKIPNCAVEKLSTYQPLYYPYIHSPHLTSQLNLQFNDWYQ